MASASGAAGADEFAQRCFNAAQFGNLVFDNTELAFGKRARFATTLPVFQAQKGLDLFQRKPKLLRPLDENDTLYSGG